MYPSIASVSSAQNISEPSAIAVASTSATKQIRYQFGIPGGIISGPAVVKNGITYMDIRGIAANAGLKMEWDKTGKRAQFSGWTKSFTVQIGSSKGILDGKTVDLGGSPYTIKEDFLYVPARFVVKVFEGTNLRMNAKTNTLLADGLKTYHTFTK